MTSRTLRGGNIRAEHFDVIRLTARVNKLLDALYAAYTTPSIRLVNAILVPARELYDDLTPKSRYREGTTQLNLDLRQEMEYILKQDGLAWIRDDIEQGGDDAIPNARERIQQRIDVIENCLRAARDIASAISPDSF